MSKHKKRRTRLHGYYIIYFPSRPTPPRESKREKIQTRKQHIHCDDGLFRENTGKTRLTETSRSETHACLFLSPSFVSIHKQYWKRVFVLLLSLLCFLLKRETLHRRIVLLTHSYRRWIESSQQRTHTNKHTNKQTNKQTNTRNVCVCICSFNASSSSRDGGTDEDTSRYSQFRRAQQR